MISTDDMRRELRESGIITGDPGVLDAGLYSPDNVTTVYEVALRRARLCLGNGQSVILDGTWRDPHIRAQAHRVATETLSAVVELMCTATVDTAADRIRTRQPGNSDVTPEIATTLAAQHTAGTPRTGWTPLGRSRTQCKRPTMFGVEPSRGAGHVNEHSAPSTAVGHRRLDTTVFILPPNAPVVKDQRLCRSAVIPVSYSVRVTNSLGVDMTAEAA